MSGRDVCVGRVSKFRTKEMNLRNLKESHSPPQEPTGAVVPTRTKV